MQKVNELKNKIIVEWSIDSNQTSPYEFILDKVGEVTKDTRTNGDYIRELIFNDHVTEFIEAIDYGFDDLAGFTFFYLVKYFRRDTDLLGRLYYIKHGCFPHQDPDWVEQG